MEMDTRHFVCHCQNGVRPGIKPANFRNLVDVIDNMLAVIPPEKTQTNASLVIGLLSIRDSASFAPPEGMNLHWRRVLNVLGDAFGDEPHPGWPTKMYEIFRGGPVRQETGQQSQERRSLQRMQIEHQTVYAHFKLQTSLPEHLHEVGYLTIAMLPDQAAFHLSGKASEHNFYYGLSICAIGEQFHRSRGRTESLRRLIAYVRHGDEGTRYPIAGEAIIANGKALHQGDLLRGIVALHLKAARERDKGPTWLLHVTVAKRV